MGTSLWNFPRFRLRYLEPNGTLHTVAWMDARPFAFLIDTIAQRRQAIAYFVRVSWKGRSRGRWWIERNTQPAVLGR
jgi:hypothetical protein